MAYSGPATLLFVCSSVAVGMASHTGAFPGSPRTQVEPTADVAILADEETPAEDAGPDPGGTYILEDDGACAGLWAEDHDHDGTGGEQPTDHCLHADAATGGAADDTELDKYSDEYTAELGGNPKFCADSDPLIDIMYVTTEARADHHAEYLDKMRERSTRADYWLFLSAKASGGVRHFRFACTPGGAIRIKDIVLPNTADNSWDATSRAVKALDPPPRENKYFAFIDWQDTGPGGANVCGRGEMWPDDDPAREDNDNNKGGSFSGIYIGNSRCGNWANLMLHELGHVLGGVQASAPHHDPQNRSHPRDALDVMAYGDNTYSRCTSDSSINRYDCGDDDYFDIQPSAGSYLDRHWDIARSSFLSN